MRGTGPDTRATDGGPRRDLKRTAIATLAAAAVGVIAIEAWPLIRPKPPTARQIRQRLLEELQPITLKNCTLQRIGGANDGGYLMCGNLLGNVRSAYSYGIGVEDEWGCQISKRLGVPVHEYDCFNPIQPACPGGQPRFHDECIGARRETIDSRTFDSLRNQISKNGDAGKTLVVKIDVEGAELDSLLAMPDRVLRSIDQLAMELHGTERRYLDLVRKLKRTFHVVHLHFNNQACAARFNPFPAWAYQVSFVNRRIGVPDPAAPPPVLPHRLDAPDFSVGRDCQVQGPLDP
jgi:hypothetical protein